MDRLYAQIDDNGICFCVGTPKTNIEVPDYSYIGKKYIDEVWEEISQEPTPYTPTNIEIAQMISDLQADLIIAGVI